MTNSEAQMNKREPNYNVPKKTIPLRSMKKQRKYFDSADWMLAGAEYQKESYPVKSSAKKNEEDDTKSNQTTVVEEVRDEQMQDQQTQQVNDLPNNDDEDKENRDTQLAGMAIQHPHSHLPQKSKQDRKYFDSADWVLENKVVPNKTYRSFPQPDPRTILTKKKLEKSRKFFDSADWALEHGKYVPQIYPKLPVLQH